MPSNSLADGDFRSQGMHCILFLEILCCYVDTHAGFRLMGSSSLATLASLGLQLRLYVSPCRAGTFILDHSPSNNGRSGYMNIPCQFPILSLLIQKVHKLSLYVRYFIMLKIKPRTLQTLSKHYLWATLSFHTKFLHHSHFLKSP